ncbi:hypothetical protein [Pseudomonas sp. Irchel s3f19]|uniref:hypothetical protein n=1 Tax=Pseudomonas sp. Irchel s3f19 TaxID=2009146 RepID=UPI000BA3A42F|nr:hypothetical protein [Pseudomonas sp. Irchel s3f19]
MTAWNLAELRSLVEAKFGRQQKEVLAPSLNSVLQRGAFAKYHYLEAKRLLDEATAAHTDPSAMMMLVLGADDASEAFSEARFQSQAHITACVQSMHATADILAHTVYYALGMNLDPATELKLRNIDMVNVMKKVTVAPVLQALTSLTDHDGFRYISALNNHSKHRSIVEASYSVDFTEAGMPNGLKFAGFEHGGQAYDARWVKPTLDPEYARQSSLIIDAGRALNTHLASLPS